MDMRPVEFQEERCSREQQGIRWTESARARVHPRRGMALEAAPAEEVCKEFRRRFDPARLKPLLGTATPTVARLLRQAQARLEGGGNPRDVEVEAILAVACGIGSGWGDQNQTVWTLPEYWAGAVSPAFMLEVMGATLHFSREHSFLDGSEYLCRKYPSVGQLEGGLLGPWTSARRALVRASEREFEAASQVASRLRGSTPLPFRCALSFAFPEHKAWAEADLQECLQNPVTLWGTRQILPRCGWWLLASLDATGVETLFREHGCEFMDVDLAFSVIDGLGTPGGPLLVELLGGKERNAEARKELAEAATLVETPEMADLLRPHLDDSTLRPIVSAYYRRNPSLSIPALAGSRSENARTLLGSLVRAHPEAARQSLEKLPEKERGTLQSLLERASAVHPEARLDRLPRVLADPPWKKKRAARELRVVALAPLELEEEVHWPRGGKPRPYYYNRPPLREDAARHRRVLETLKTAAKKGLSPDDLDRLPDSLALEFWNDLPDRAMVRYPWDGWEPLLARFGTAGLPGFLKLAGKESARLVSTLANVRSPRIALLMAEALERLKGSRPTARAWLLRFSDEAAAGLIPLAVGPAGKPREQAEAALRFLVSQGGRECVTAMAERYGPQAREAVEESLAFDPLQLFPARLPKMPEFWTPAAFSRPLLRDGSGALGLEAVEHLGTMLAFAPPDSSYAGIEQVKQACLLETLDDFVWDLFSAWLGAGAPAKESWAFSAAGHLGSDETARKLAPLIRAWPGESAHNRAVQGLEVLAAIGTDMALMHLHKIAQVKYKALQARAQEKIEEVAAARNLSPEELADRLVPDLDLEPDGSRWLDFGPRRFRVDFDERLTPRLYDEAGKALKNLPKPRQGDAPEKAAEAERAWKGLKKDAKTLAETQILRLERAMCRRRRWAGPVFQDFLLHHPLMSHLVRRLLWGVYDGEGRLEQVFRVAEDRTLADQDDAALELPSQAVVGLPHRLELPADHARRWSELFSDYEILQPFPQLARAIHTPSAAELSGQELEQLPRAPMPVGRLLKLEARGWRRGAVVDSGCACHFEKPLARGLEAILEVEPGFHVAAPQEADPQTVRSVYVQSSESAGRKLPLKDLDAIEYSELVTDLATLGG
ncbi:MAG: DUF4132 domain-containing protein [Armatimonadetes bacterium]|nr:DUF4132 domain-containing protein [Armatimonadota bacterium]